jgi:hypothetical protein
MDAGPVKSAPTLPDPGPPNSRIVTASKWRISLCPSRESLRSEAVKSFVRIDNVAGLVRRGTHQPVPGGGCEYCSTAAGAAAGKGRVKALIEERIIDVRDESEQQVQRDLSLALVDREWCGTYINT